MFWFYPRKTKLIDEVYEKDVFPPNPFYPEERIKEVEEFQIPRGFIEANYPYPYLIDISQPIVLPPVLDIPYSYKNKVRVVTTNNDDFASRLFEAYFRAQSIKFKYLFS